MANENLMEDPIVVYIIVREELHMTIDKATIQVANAVQKLLLHYFAAQLLCACKKTGALPKIEAERVQITSEWINHNSQKEILKASESEWSLIKNEFGKNSIVVVDNKTTDHYETVICLYPKHVSEVSDTIKKLHSL